MHTEGKSPVNASRHELREMIYTELFNELRNQRTKINGQISEINLNGKIKIQEIKNSSSNKNEIDRLKNQIDKIDKNIDSLRSDNTNLSSQKDSKVFGSNKKGIDKIRWNRMFTFIHGEGVPKSYLIHFLILVGLWNIVSRYLLKKKTS
jgi:uncharacterized coiled-coil DUF342 family protein